MKNKKAQSVVEYVVITCVVFAALLASAFIYKGPGQSTGSGQESTLDTYFQAAVKKITGVELEVQP